jgi:hypothetical protein
VFRSVTIAPCGTGARLCTPILTAGLLQPAYRLGAGPAQGSSFSQSPVTSSMTVNKHVCEAERARHVIPEEAGIQVFQRKQILRFSLPLKNCIGGRENTYSVFLLILSVFSVSNDFSV